MTVTAVDLTSKGTPTILLTLPEAGNESKLTLTVSVADAVSNDYTADTFAAYAGERGTALTTLTVATPTYDAGTNVTTLVVTFPAATIPERGRFVVTWLAAADTNIKKIVIGDYVRDSTAVAFGVY